LTWQPPTSGTGAANLANFSTGNALTTYGTAGVPPGTYFVRARTRTVQGKSAASNEVQLFVASACAPNAPGTPAVAFNSGGTVVLTWTAATGSPDAYIVEAGTAPGLSNVAVANVGSGTRLMATGVGNGTYYVRMRAQNACGMSAPSGELSVVSAAAGN
jgi:predicted phage tail protein